MNEEDSTENKTANFIRAHNSKRKYIIIALLVAVVLSIAIPYLIKHPAEDNIVGSWSTVGYIADGEQIRVPEAQWETFWDIKTDGQTMRQLFTFRSNGEYISKLGLPGRWEWNEKTQEYILYTEGLPISATIDQDGFLIMTVPNIPNLNGIGLILKKD